MPPHDVTDQSSYFDRLWPLEPGVNHVGCAACDRAIAEFLALLEGELRRAWLALWVAGWTPHELLAEIRATTGCRDAPSLMAGLVVSDEDVAPGWLGIWLATRPSPGQASACLKAVTDALMRLVRPRDV